MNTEEKIKQLKMQRDAVILAHYYVPKEVQAIADYIGDSFYLSKLAQNISNQTIVFCGVSFMGEAAVILNPQKVVLLPDETASCPMADMINLKQIEQVRSKYEDLAVVCYINSSAQAKACSDVCVTSSNAIQICKKLPQKNIYFIPDRHLGEYIASQIPEKNFILSDGYCPVHHAISQDEIITLQNLYPNSEIVAHPECPQSILDKADFIGSTKAIINYVCKTPAKEFIVCTEVGIAYALQKNNPNKIFHFPKSQPICHHMKKITLEKIINVLSEDTAGVQVNTTIANQAMPALNQMLALSER